VVDYRGEGKAMTSLLQVAARNGQVQDMLPQKQPHVLICTPCHSGKVDLNYHISLTYALHYLAKAGVNFTLDYNIGMTVDWARSQMATRCLRDTEFTHLLFIDDDMGFAADLPFRMLRENVDIVAVPYRRKQKDIKYNIRHGVRVKTIPGRPYMIGVESIATGMMMIRRNVFEALESKVTKFLYNDKGEDGYLFFRHQLVDDEMVGGVSYMGEDYYFCKTARDNGFEVWAYVDEPIAHIGVYAYDGNYKDHAGKGTTDKFDYPGEREPMRIITL
jgi:hypothetical protein